MNDFRHNLNKYEDLKHFLYYFSRKKIQCDSVKLMVDDKNSNNDIQYYVLQSKQHQCVTRY